jgi:hypothetical protein
MESISRLPRRLTQLYSATTSYPVVEDKTTSQPEVNALHRKYRIQKDRLVAWGLEWSDKGNHEIDEGVERAGLTETVTSVLATIQQILQEAEAMQHSAMAAGAKTITGEKSRHPTPSWAPVDRSRYEDLARDLTDSIDILYDLSRTRRTQRGTSPAKTVSDPPPQRPATSVFAHSQYSASDVTLINPGTIPFTQDLPKAAPQPNLPPRLDPSDLVLPEEE